jgi:TonB-dependent starch-binding outer membrane protein SusC
MRISGFVVLISLLTMNLLIASPGNGQYLQKRIDISVKDTGLQELFQQIENKTQVEIMCEMTPRLLKEVFTVNIHNQSVEDILNNILLPRNIKWSIRKNYLLIQDAAEKIKLNTPTLFDEVPPIDVRGRIVNDKGEPAAGVTITVKSTERIIATDNNGEFILNNIDGKSVLIISGANIETLETKINDKVIINIIVTQKVSDLDETVVIAYGTTTKRLNTGSISTVKAADIEKQPVTNALQALQGRVPGLMIEQTNGLPGSSFNVKIRGQNGVEDLGKTGDPLYVIDGVPYNSQMPAETLNPYLGRGSALDFINPKDIESIEILKDADATSIYGSRAANGAILITTKKAKVGAMQLGLDVYTGISKSKRNLKLLSTEQYLAVRREALKNDGIDPSPSDYDVNGTWDVTRYTDWVKELEQNPSQFTNAQASLSGGNELTQYLIKGGVSTQEIGLPRVVKNTGVNKNASVHFNVNSFSKNKRFQLNLTGSFLRGTNTAFPGDQSIVFGIAPDAPALYNTDGTLNWQPLAPGQPGTFVNPISYYYAQFESQTSNLLSNAVLSYKIFKGLELKSNLGYTELIGDQKKLTPTKVYDPAYKISSGSAQFQSLNIRWWNIEPYLNYHTTIGQSAFTFLIGSTFQENNNQSQNISANGFVNDDLLGNMQNAATITRGGALDNQYKYTAVFGRINYNWQDRYLLNVNLRRDGSSRFGPGKQFHTFASIGGAYIFTQASFFRKKLPFLSFGKIRGSYGTSGSDSFSDYQFLDLYSVIPRVNPYQGIGGLAPQSQFNADLAWEETRKMDIGLALGLFKDRITVDGNYYRNRTGNQLVSNPLSGVTGFNVIAFNLPAIVQNSGFEFSLSTVNLHLNDFKWSSSFNISFNRNKLVSFPQIELTAYKNIYIVGKPLNSIKVFNYAGVNSTTGLYQFVDNKGNLTSNPSDPTDKTEIVNLLPKYFGGFLNTFEYKSVSLSFLFQFVKQTGQNINGAYPTWPGQKYNIPTLFLDRWQKPGDHATYQKYSSGYNNYIPWAYARLSTWAYSNASFIRLKNVSLSWQLPESWQKNIGLKMSSLYLQGQNLVTITNYKGFDPEIKGIGIPPAKIWTIGFKTSL